MQRNTTILLVLILLSTACKVNHLVSQEPVFYEVDNDQALDADTTVLAMIGPYRLQLEKEMGETIGTLGANLEKGRPESSLGNLVADALLAKCRDNFSGRVDFAIANAGGLRLPGLSEGPLQRGKIFELLPFDNIMVVLEMSGAEVEDLADHMAGQGGWPQSEQLRYRIVNNAAEQVRLNGEPLEPNERYWVAMPDYVANGGSNSGFLRNIPQHSTGKFMRDLVIDYIKEQTGPITAKKDGRVEVFN